MGSRQSGLVGLELAGLAAKVCLSRTLNLTSNGLLVQRSTQLGSRTSYQSGIACYSGTPYVTTTPLLIFLLVSYSNIFSDHCKLQLIHLTTIL